MDNSNFIGSLIPQGNNSTIGNFLNPFSKGYINELILSNGLNKLNYYGDSSQDMTPLSIRAGQNNYYYGQGEPLSIYAGDTATGTGISSAYKGGDLNLYTGANSAVSTTSTAGYPAINLYASNTSNSSWSTGTIPTDYTKAISVSAEKINLNITSYTVSIIPNGNNIHSLGTSSSKWNNVYSTAFTGDLVGNVTGNISGSSGSCTGNANTATTLATSRTIQTNLASATAVGFNGSTNITPGVTGILPVANGGTGQSSLSNVVVGTAAKLSNTSVIGSTTKPVYFTAAGIPATINYTLSAACEYGVTDSSSASAISTGTSVPTERDIYYGLPNINNSHTYTSSTSVYAPITGGTAGQLLYANGATSTPTWTNQSNIAAGTATKFNSVRTIALTGNVTGSVSSDGTSGWSIPTTISSGVVTNAMLSGGIENSKLSSSSITIGSTAVPLGGSITVLTGISSINASGSITGSAVYNAVFNDIVDCIEVKNQLLYGRCYYFNGKDYLLTTKKCQKGTMGIHSDTAGFEVGNKGNVNQFKVSIGGFVLAYIDKDYKCGTPLTSSKNGILTKMTLLQRLLHPERIVGIFWKEEPNKYWGTRERQIEVNGRKWVKIK